MRRAPTAPEQKLWQALRHGGLNSHKIRRQQPIGRYIADFFCRAAKLVIEVDGWTHAGPEAGAGRDEWMQRRGIRVLRFWNHDVMDNLPGVLATILAAALPPPPTPSLKGRGLSSPFEHVRPAAKHSLSGTSP